MLIEQPNPTIDNVKMTSGELKKRTKAFAHGVVKLAVMLPRTTLGDHVRKQLIRCATSVAANYRAALLSQTRASFVAKISIVVEEADEAEFWLAFSVDENLMPQENILPLLNEAHELVSLFIATRKTAQSKNQSTATTRKSNL